MPAEFPPQFQTKFFFFLFSKKKKKHAYVLYAYVAVVVVFSMSTFTFVYRSWREGGRNKNSNPEEKEDDPRLMRIIYGPNAARSICVEEEQRHIFKRRKKKMSEAFH